MRFGQFVFASLVVSLSATRAHAQEWPMFRHDPRRSGASPAQVGIDRPAVSFRTYLGGALAASQMLDLDVDGDGTSEVIYVSGGRVVAKRGDNVAVWESEILPVDTLWATADFDGDGELELVLSRTRPIPAAVVVLRARDGTVAWQMPAGTTDWLGGISIGDLDGDGSEDLYVGSGMCGTGVMGPPGTAFSFCTAGACSYAGARTLWTLPASIEGGNCGNGGVIGDVTGDGRAEIVIPWQHQQLPIYAGDTGALIGTLPAFDPGDYDRGATLVTLVQLDADPALEIVTHGDYYNSGYGSRRVALYEHDGGAFVQRWQIALADLPNDRVLFDPVGGIADLDGDGDRELVIGRYESATTTWTTTVHDALTGALVATHAGSVLRGVADVDGDGTSEILVEVGGAIEAHALAGGALSMRFSIPMRTVVRFDDPALRARALARSRVLTMQLDDDPADELLLGESGAAGIVALHAYDTDVSPPALLGSFRAPEGVSILASAELGPVTRPHAQPGIATSDGYFLILDRALRVTNRIEGEFPEPGMRVGGYYTGPGGQRAAPVIAAFSDAPSILVGDSRGALVRLDASDASPAAPPVVRDTLFGARFPTITDLDGAAPRELIVVEGQRVVRRDAAPGLTERWRSPVLATGGVFNDAIPATLSGGARGLFVTAFESNSDWVGIALDGATGAVTWRTPTPRVLGWGVGNNGLHAAGELTGDAVDDLACTVNGVLVSDGATGADAFTGGAFMARGGTMLTSIDGDASLEVYGHGGYQPARAVSRAGAVQWTWEPRVALDSFAAEVRCGAETALVGGAFGSPDLWTLRARDGVEVAHRSFAGGRAYAAGAIPAAERPGSFGNVTALAGLDRAGAPGLLAGSSDGHLYALDPCTLDVRWAIDLRYPVGEAVAGDLDADGDEEIVVSVADGHLYGITHGAYDAPEVRDVEAGAPAVDVDEIDASDTLHAAWDPIAGATSYVVSVFTAQGSEIRFPNARDVGDVTEADLPMLPLVPGGTYVVAVQAVGPSGPGLEGRSDGVTITDTLPPVATIDVLPTRAWPPAGVVPEVRATCTDRVALARVEVEIRSAGGTTVRTLDARDVPRMVRVTSSATWDGRDEGGADAVPGSYLAHVRCVDGEGREATAESPFALDPAVVSEGDAGARADGGPTREPPPAGGCGCVAPGARATAPMASVLALLALALARRARRRRPL